MPEDHVPPEASVEGLPEGGEPLALNCPQCPQRMRFVRTTSSGVHIFVCSEHGEWHLGYGGLYPSCDPPWSGR